MGKSCMKPTWKRSERLGSCQSTSESRWIACSRSLHGQSRRPARGWVSRFNFADRPLYSSRSYLDFLDRPDPPPIRNMTYISEIFQRERREMKQVGKLGINAKELIDTVEQLF